MLYAVILMALPFLVGEETVLRNFLNVAACILLSVMLAEPMLVSRGMGLPNTPDLALVALGVAGVMLGRRGGYRIAGA